MNEAIPLLFNMPSWNVQGKLIISQQFHKYVTTKPSHFFNVLNFNHMSILGPCIHLSADHNYHDTHSMGWTLQELNTVRARFSISKQTSSKTQPASCTMGTGSPGRE
jgi:hypothetical protein